MVFSKMRLYSFLLFLFLATIGCGILYPSQDQIAARNAAVFGILSRGQNKTEQPAQQQEPSITEEELTNRIATLPKVEKPVEFSRKKDGFDVNGVRYLDSEGPIVNYSGDALTGDVTYVIQTDPGKYIVKFIRVLTNTEPAKIATAEKTYGQWSIQTATGKKLKGDGLIPLSMGFAVARQASAFFYTPGGNVRNVAAPDGFNIAGFQHGEVTQSRYILVERDKPSKESDGGTLDKLKSVGAILGINKKEDYALVNIDNGQRVLLNIDVNGKDVTVLSDCRRSGSFAGVNMNKCAKADFVESLYDENGLPNAEHYFWRVSWFNSNLGPLIVVREGSKVYIKNLKENKMVVAFERTLGINWVTAHRKGDGRIEAVAKLGFSEEKIDDVEAFYREHQPVPFQ